MQKDILFIDAACKSREKFLLGKDKILRIAEQDSFEDAIKLLKEYGFGKTAEEGADLYSLIYAEEEDLIAFIKEYAPKGGVKYYFLLPYDFSNAEALFKCKKLGLKEDKYLTHEGSCTIEELKNALDKNTPCIPEIACAYNEAEKLFDSSETPSGAMVDAVFTRFLYKALIRLVKDPATKKLIKRDIDFKNVSSLMRCDTRDEYEIVKLPFTTLSKEDEDAILSKDRAKIEQAFKYSPLKEFVYPAVFEAGGPLLSYEKLTDGFAVTTLRETRFFNKGKEPYLLYVSYRKADIKNVRLVLLGIKAGKDKTIIKNKLRESYS